MMYLFTRTGIAVVSAKRLRSAGGARRADQVVQRGRQPVHLVHYGGARGDLAKPAQDYR